MLLIALVVALHLGAGIIALRAQQLQVLLEQAVLSRSSIGGGPRLGRRTQRRCLARLCQRRALGQGRTLCVMRARGSEG